MSPDKNEVGDILASFKASDNYNQSLDEALIAIYEIGLGAIGEDLPELPYDGTPETEMKNANIRAVNRSKASQRKAWAKACGVAE